MKCQEDGCPGIVNPEIAVSLRVTCRDTQDAYPCSTCGRLHWQGGEPVFNRQEHRAFLREGKVVHLDASDTIIKY